jgi:hypothetical protein
MNIPSDELQAFHHLIRERGRDVADFTAVLSAEGHVHVRGPNGSAFYPRSCWIASFSRHLDRSFFELPERAPQGLQRSAGELSNEAGSPGVRRDSRPH